MAGHEVGGGVEVLVEAVFEEQAAGVPGLLDEGGQRDGGDEQAEGQAHHQLGEGQAVLVPA